MVERRPPEESSMPSVVSSVSFNRLFIQEDTVDMLSPVSATSSALVALPRVIKHSIICLMLFLFIWSSNSLHPTFYEARKKFLWHYSSIHLKCCQYAFTLLCTCTNADIRILSFCQRPKFCGSYSSNRPFK